MILVTGGAGFIGSSFVNACLAAGCGPVIVADVLSYSGSLKNLESVIARPDFHFRKLDIGDSAAMDAVLHEFRPRAIVNFAAETHVDRSILGPRAFFATNVDGTLSLLEAARKYWTGLDASPQREFRFLHVSTDEVYGTLSEAEPAFTEASRYAPNSPYAASKAASDHMVRAWFRTYGLPTLTVNCSNNYGPRQFPEKLIPLMFANALAGKDLPIYGDGRQVRDWLFVDDHVAALCAVLDRGRVGEVYNVGGGNQISTLEVVGQLCGLLDELCPRAAGRYQDLIRFVADRPGHDRRYAIDSSKIQSELGWQPQVEFASGLRKTLVWYLENSAWLAAASGAAHQEWLAANYSGRTGVAR